MKKIKEIHRSINNQIREKKAQRRLNKGFVQGLHELRIEIRHRHIAYCILRGRTLDQIEPKRDHEPSDSLINKYNDEYLELLGVNNEA